MAAGGGASFKNYTRQSVHEKPADMLMTSLRIDAGSNNTNNNINNNNNHLQEENKSVKF